MRYLTILIIIIFSFSFKLKKDDKLANGYIITQSGDKINVKFILEEKAILISEESDCDISDYRMQNSPNYINDKGKKEKVDKSNLKEYGIEFISHFTNW